ncbi:MAG TPA: hypothetical protein VJ720_00170, partial [Chitinophaga sp.]|nr:hypothetical protein [Chitinophaga sp.]
GLSLAVVLILLIGLKLLEKYISSANEKRVYRILYHRDRYTNHEIAEFFNRFGLKCKQLQYIRKESVIEEKYEASGSLRAIEELNSFLLNNNNIHHFEVQNNPL